MRWVENAAGAEVLRRHVPGERWLFLRYEDFAGADEIFISGNYSKVMPVLRIDSRDLQPGPFYRKARELYWEFAHA